MDGDIRASGSLDAIVGTITHKLFELIVRQGLDHWSEERVRLVQPAVLHQLSREGVVGASAGAAADRVLAMVTKTLVSEQGRWILGAHESDAVEQALATVDGDNVSLNIIDRTFVDQGVRWIIDYKTTRISGGVSEEALHLAAEKYREQLQRYGGLLADEGLPIRTGVWFSEYAVLVELN